MITSVLSKIMIRFASFFIVLMMIFVTSRDFEPTVFELEIFHPISELEVGYNPLSSHQGLYLIQDSDILIELFGDTLPHYVLQLFNQDFFKKYSIVGYIIYAPSNPSLILQSIHIDDHIIRFDFFQCSDCLMTADRELYQGFYVVRNRYLSNDTQVTANLFD